jgi:diacylglycerol kinase family enzyme
LRGFAVKGVTCILNAGSGPGHGPDLGLEITRLLDASGFHATVVTVADGAEVVSQARQALELGHLILAGGGDGTVNAVASTLVGTDGVLGVLPLGTCNHFARDLGLPLDLRSAVHTALNGRVRAVDVGEVNGQIFLNNSSLGIYSKLVFGRIAEERQGHRKLIALAMAAVSCLRHPYPLLVRLQCDGGDVMVRRTPLLFVGNNRYDTMGLRIGRRSQLDAGQLWMCVAQDIGYAGLVGLTMRALRGRWGPNDLDARGWPISGSPHDDTV